MQKTRAVAIKNTAQHTIEHMIKPLVEMFPLEVVDSLHGAKFELFPARKNDKPHRRELRELLNRTHGVYVFYDSRGSALYVGKAKA